MLPGTEDVVQTISAIQGQIFNATSSAKALPIV
jgi:hypothetical protein